MKKCSKCKQTKSKGDFHKSTSEWDGLRGYCKECCSQASAKFHRKIETENPGVTAAVTALYRARQLNCVPSWVKMEDLLPFYKEADQLTRDTGTPHNVDHIHPLVHPLLSGLHVPWNLQILTRSANCKKNNKVDFD